MTFWSAKHQEISFSLNLTPSAIHLWQWILANRNPDAYDLRDFNEWVQTHRGKPYHRDTLKAAIALLEEKGVIAIVREFAWNVRRIVCFGVDKILKKPLRKKSQNPAGNRKSPPGNSLFAATHEPGSLQQQQYVREQKEIEAEELVNRQEDEFNQNIELIRSAGIELNHHQCDWLKAFSPQEVAMAIAYLLSQKDVKNPPGFLRRALEQGWEYYYVPRPIDWNKLHEKFAQLIPNWRK